MVMIKEHDEDTLYDAMKSFINSRGFKEYLDKQVDKLRKHDSGHKIEKSEFNLRSFKYAVINNEVRVCFVFNVKPACDTVQEILTDRYYENDGKEEVRESFNSWVDEIAENVQEVIWAAVYNYPVLRVVNGGLDSVPLGDVVDFDIDIIALNEFYFEDNVR